MSRIEPRSFTLKTGEPGVVRSAEAADAPALIAHGEGLTRDPLNVTAPGEFQMTVEEEEAWIREHDEKDGWLAIVAEVEGEVVGMLNVRRAPRRRLAHRCVFGMGVDEPWRGRGVGDALLTTLVAWAEAHPELEKIGLGVMAENEPAVRLYEKHGFREEGRYRREVKRDDGTYLDDLRMYRFVDGPGDVRA